MPVELFYNPTRNTAFRWPCVFLIRGMSTIYRQQNEKNYFAYTKPKLLWILHSPQLLGFHTFSAVLCSQQCFLPFFQEPFGSGFFKYNHDIRYLTKKDVPPTRQVHLLHVQVHMRVNTCPNQQPQRSMYLHVQVHMRVNTTKRRGRLRVVVQLDRTCHTRYLQCHLGLCHVDPECVHLLQQTLDFTASADNPPGLWMHGAIFGSKKPNRFSDGWRVPRGCSGEQVKISGSTNWMGIWILKTN